MQLGCKSAKGLYNQAMENLRNTRARTLILEIFEKCHLPITAMEILERLKDAGCKANKTTVYRQIDTLIAIHLIKEVYLGDGKARYERICEDHHHHRIVCRSCKAVDEIKVQDDVGELEKRISKEKKFKVLSHSLEFFGICQSCLTKNHE